MVVLVGSEKFKVKLEKTKGSTLNELTQYIDKYKNYKKDSLFNKYTTLFICNN